MSEPQVTTATLRIPETPPSFNAIGLHSHWAAGRRHKKQWQEWLETALMAEAVPRGFASCTASARMQFPQRRRRDEGNFRVILEKALGDALVNGGWIPDDTGDQYRFGAVTLAAPSPSPETIVTLALSR